MFWGVFLLAIPIGISIVEIDVGIQRFPPQPLPALALLITSTLLVVWAALTLAVRGGGTPLSLDPTRELVATGPYAYIRHPFVAGVVAQMVAFGLALGSVPVLAYAAVTFTIWYYGVRPREERALEARFGARVNDYHRQVRGFRPF